MKKRISILLILAMLLLPFSMLLDVKAEPRIQIITDPQTNKVVDVVSASDNNVHLGTITLNMRNDTGTSTIRAYKVVDIYYHANSFEYQFTADFAAFVATLTAGPDYSFIRSITGDDTKTTFTVDDYLALTSDNTGNGNDEYYHNTTSTLNKLVSKYATFIRNNPSRYTNNSNVRVMDVDQSNLKYTLGIEQSSAKVVPGSYLLLPDSITVYTDLSDDIPILVTMTYGAMVANVDFGVTQGEYVLHDATINSKADNSRLGTVIATADVAKIVNDIYNEDFDAFDTDVLGGDGSLVNGKRIAIISYRADFANIPANAHESIKNNQTVNNLLQSYEIALPTSMEFDFNGVSVGIGNMNPELNLSYTTEVSGGVTNIYVVHEDENQQEIRELLATATDARHLTVYNDMLIDAFLKSAHGLTAGQTENVVFTHYYLKDPYANIGSNVTEADIRNAIEKEGTAEDTTAYATIRNGIGVMTQSKAITTYGLTINNVNTNNNNLNGAVFKVCQDAACTKVIKDNITISNGTANFVGVSDLDTIYIQQTTAPTGYRLADTVAVDLSEQTLDANNYFTATVTNQPLLALPFTGGSGTVIYTCLGLLIIAGSAIFLVMYKNKNKNKKIETLV